MATFAKSTFNASIYSSSRPTYPTKLFDFIFNYHRRSENARWERAVDVGCGTGQATSRLQGRFHEVIGVDPSGPMLEKARAQFASKHSGTSSENSSFRFLQGSAEDLQGIIEDNSVDLLIAAQAAHWFDWSKVWPETHRVLHPGGTAAYWVYSELRLSAHPSLTPLITQYAQGSDPKTSLGPHFQRPGRTILENHLLDVPEPNKFIGKGLGNVERVYFAGTHHLSLPAEQTHPVIMKKEMRWRDLLGYLRTWSPLHTYHELYPEDKEVVDSRFPNDLLTVPELYSETELEDIDISGGDIAIRFWKDLREGAAAEGAMVGADDKVDVEWPIALLLVRKME